MFALGHSLLACRWLVSAHVEVVVLSGLHDKEVGYWMTGEISGSRKVSTSRPQEDAREEVGKMVGIPTQGYVRLGRVKGVVTNS